MTDSQNPTVAEGLAALDKLTRDVAESVRPLIAEADLPAYKNFLNAMYHYTKGSEERLNLAASVTTDPKMEAYYIDQAREERGHYMLALRDLQALGHDPLPDPPSEVVAFEASWAAIKPEGHTAFIGGSYVFENIAVMVTPDIIAVVKRLELERSQARWLLVHMEADIDHGEEATEMATAYLPVDATSMLEGAREASRRWTDLMRSAFTATEPLPVWSGKR